MFPLFRAVLTWIYILVWDSLATRLVQDVCFPTDLSLRFVIFGLSWLHCRSGLWVVLFVLFLNSSQDVGRDSDLGGLHYPLVFLF